MPDPGGPRQLGDYLQSNDWSDYWTTSVSLATDSQLLLRGYPIEEVIDRLSYADVMFLALRGELPTAAQSRVLDAVLCSIPANQWIAAHLLAAATTASASPESPIPGIASGILTMGSVTVSPQATAELIERTQELVAETGDRGEAAKRVVEEYRERRERIPGLGHPTRKDHDPRATALAEVAKREGVWGETCELYAQVRQAFVDRSGKELVVNIDGMLACVLAELGFSPREMGGIAAVAAMPGIVAYVIEEIERGVPLRIVPEALGSKYIGPAERHIPDDPERAT